MGGKNATRKPPTLVLSCALLAIWFSSSVCSTLVNKQLMDHFPYAVTLSAVHMLSAALVDLAIVWYRGLNLTYRKDVVWSCFPVASAINFGKVMTYVSYGLVPASLTHTAKASSPVFSVLVSKVLFNQVPTFGTFISLIPITLGVTLSALTEIDFVFLGLLAAVGAALANVLNSTYTKKGLHHTNAPDPLIFHMYTAVVAVVMLLPYALVVEFPTITMWQRPEGAQGPVALEGTIGETAAADVAATITTHVFPWRSMFLSVALHYAQNISNIYFLNGVSVLTHQVAQSLKRLVNIAGAVLYFGNHVAPLNAAGMGLALLGFSMYSAAKQKANAQAQAAEGKKDKPDHSNSFLQTPVQSTRSVLSSPTLHQSSNGTNGTTELLAYPGSGTTPGVVAKGPAALLHSANTPVTILVESLHGGGNMNGASQSSGKHSHLHIGGEFSSWSVVSQSPSDLLRGGLEDEQQASASPERSQTTTLHHTAHAHALMHAQALAAQQAAAYTNLTIKPNDSPPPEEDNQFCV